MKLLFSGSKFCDNDTLKRLLLISDEISFMDRPSVTFKGWGTIGSDSPARKIDSTDSPVKLSVYKPPSGPVFELYQPYIEKDIQNNDFVKVFLEGLKQSKKFASKFIQLNADYTTGKGSDILSAIINDPNIINNPLEPEVKVIGPDLFPVSNSQNRRETLKVLLIEASIQVTSSLIVSEKEEIIPVTDEPYFAQLIAMRNYHSNYVGMTSRMSPFLGLELIKSVIPDEILQKLSFTDIINFRKKTVDIYSEWSNEINRFAAQLNGVKGENVRDEIFKIIVTELKPQLVKLRNEMKSVRNTLFKDLIKHVLQWEFPSLSIAYFTNVSVVDAIMLFATPLLRTVPDIISYFQSKKEISRKYSMSYLIGISPDNKK